MKASTRTHGGYLSLLLLLLRLGLLLLVGTSTLSARAAAPPPAVQMPAATDAPVADPFQRLRRPSVTPQPDYWHRVNDALQQLATLEGASYSPRYGVLTLHGKPAEGQGPFHLDDLMVALKAVYFAPDSVGMTIDPRPSNPMGPVMDVVYFGGCENTAYGWFLFECDRLLKSLSHGEDSLTGQPLRPARPDDFFNMLELARGLREQIGNEWNRFWLATDLEESPSWRKQPKRSNGYQPVLLVSDDHLAVSFRHCRLYLRTEVMALQGGKMVSVKGGKSQSAQRFAAHFTKYFDEFAEQYPVFARAAALSRLVVLAEWLEWLGEQSNLSLDTEFIRHYRQQVPVETPTRTPAKTVSLSWQEPVPNGTAQHTLQIYGGVDLKPRVFFADDQNGAAAKQRTFADTGLQAHPADLTWMDRMDGEVYRVVVVPTSTTQLRPRPAASSRHIAFGDKPPDTETPDGYLPPSPAFAAADRPEDVTRVPVSAQAIDQIRRQNARGPPASVGYAVLTDDRSLAGADRPESVPVIPQTIKPKTKTTPNKIRGPPERPAMEAESDRAERVDVIPTRPGSFVSMTDRSTLLPRPEGPPEERLAADKLSPAAAGDSPAGTRLGLSIFTARDGSTTYNLPRLCEPVCPRYQEQTGIKGRPETKITVIPHLAVMSERGDIMVAFAKPQIDQNRSVMYYPPASPAFQLRGYYPHNRSLEFDDGMRISFREDGNPGEVQLPDGTELRFRYAAATPAVHSWPRPVACEVRAAAGQAGSRVYRLVSTTAASSRPDASPAASEKPAVVPAPPRSDAAPPAYGKPAPVTAPPGPSRSAPGGSAPPEPSPAAAQPGASSERPVAAPPQAALEAGPRQPSGTEPGRQLPSAGTQPPSPPTPPVASGAAPPSVPAPLAGTGSPVSEIPNSHDAAAPSKDKPPSDNARRGTPRLLSQQKPDRLTQMAIKRDLAPGEQLVIETPILFASGTDAGQWSAALRSRDSQPTAAEGQTPADTYLKVRPLGGQALLIRLNRNRGRLEQEQVEKIQLIAERLPASDAADPPHADFFVDLQVRWDGEAGTPPERVSLPIRIERQESTQGLAVLTISVALVLLGVATYLVVRRA